MEPLPARASAIHSYNTRFVSKLRPRVSNNYGAATFAFVRSKIWEKNPPEIKKNE